MIKKQDMKTVINDDSDRDNGLLEGYKNDNTDFGLMLSSYDEHPFSTMSCILRG